MTDYDQANSPLVRYYDQMSNYPDGDIHYYVTEAVAAGGPVLELACGTGRVLIPCAQAGVTITGLDLSPAMLDVARQRIAALPADVQQRITLVQGDISTLDLGQRFRLITIPFSSFYLLPGKNVQRAALQRIYEHLEPGGAFTFSVFDPRAQIIAEHSGILGYAVKLDRTFTDPVGGQRVVMFDTREYDLSEQIVHQTWIFETLDDAGVMVRREYATLHLCYAHRYEMQYLLELCGFEIEALYGDFHRGPYRHGVYQVWIARRP